MHSTGWCCSGVRQTETPLEKWYKKAFVEQPTAFLRRGTHTLWELLLVFSNGMAAAWKCKFPHISWVPKFRHKTWFWERCSLSIFKKHSEHSEKQKLGSTISSHYETAVDMAPPWHHSATKHIFTIYWWLFSPSIKMHLQSSPSWKQFSLKQSVTVINTRIISHKAYSKEVRGNSAADFWLKVLWY